MAKLKLTPEELETMSYGDVASYILEQKGKKMNIADLFKEVIRLMGNPESDFDAHIGDFFGLLSTDKRFIMLDKGYWDLRVNHASQIRIEEDEEEEDIEVEETEEEIIDEEEDDTLYDEDSLDDDPEEDDLKDLVIIDDSESEDEL